MALKDWKKIKGRYVWNKINSNDTIKVGKVTVPVSWLGTAEKAEYRVSIGYTIRGFVEDKAIYFKTKSQALKYARAYMRRN